MTREELLALLHEEGGDVSPTEAGHLAADQALLAYINDPEITAAYDAIAKWYA